MNFCWTTLHVKNLENSLKFYTEVVGLSVNRRFKMGDQMELAFLGQAPTELELIQDAQAPQANVDGISIGFMIEGQLETLIEKLNHLGYTKQSEIISPNPSIRFMYVKDPDGFSVQFVQDTR